MPRPIPLTNLASGRYNTDENGQVTPRTPHSRTARLEGGFARLQVTEANDFDPRQTFAQQQSAPLLASSTSARFAGVRSGKPRGLEPPPQSAREHMSPMARIMAWLGIALGAILLLLLALSYTNQDMLFTTMGLPTVHHILDDARTQIIPPSHKPTAFYPNYTQFPLTGKQYRDECAKQMGQFMSHGNYWDPPHHEHGMLDAEHSNDARICRSSITYSLDGQVGLAADLALMAQVAALAREVRRTFGISMYGFVTMRRYSEIEPSSLMTRTGTEVGGQSISRTPRNFSLDLSLGACLPLQKVNLLHLVRPSGDDADLALSPLELVACPRTARYVNIVLGSIHLGLMSYVGTGLSVLSLPDTISATSS